MLIGKDVRLAEYEPSFAPFITEWMNDPEYWGPFYNVWTSTQPQWEEELAKGGDDARDSFVIKARDTSAHRVQRLAIDRLKLYDNRSFNCRS
jgi:hypothetical protein